MTMHRSDLVIFGGYKSFGPLKLVTEMTYFLLAKLSTTTKRLL